MSTRQFALLTVLAAVAAFLGGMVATKVWNVPAADAQAPPKAVSATQTVPTQGLTFAGADGRTIAKLYTDKDGSAFDLFNKQGKVGVRLHSGSPGGSLAVFNENGKTVAQVSTRNSAGFLAISADNGKSTAQLADSSGTGNGAMTLFQNSTPGGSRGNSLTTRLIDRLTKN